jgi:hypothetical protein
MGGEGSRFGPLLASLGALLLALATFLPWYEVAVSDGGTLAPASGPLPAHAGALPVYEQVTVFGAHHALRLAAIVLLVLAALALLDALVALSRRATEPNGAGGAVALFGALAFAWVLYRVLVPPAVAASAGAPSLREGAWLALLGSLMMLGGGISAHVRTAGPDRRTGPLARLQGAGPRP